MKIAQSLVVAAVVALPALSFAQSNPPLTRAEVYAQLVELQQAGYKPIHEETNYPQDILDAEARLNAQKNMTSSYGPSTAGTSSSGSQVLHASSDSQDDVPGLGPIYAKP